MGSRSDSPFTIGHDEDIPAAVGVQLKAILSDVDNLGATAGLVKPWPTFAQSQDDTWYFPWWSCTIENRPLDSHLKCRTARNIRRGYLVRSNTLSPPPEQHRAPT